MSNSTCRFRVLVATIAWLAALPAPAQVDDYRKIQYPALPEFKIDKPEVVDMPNGMKIFLLEDHELPLVRVFARIRTGSNYVPPEKAGMGSMFGQAMREGGTTTMSGDQMDDFLEARAAFVETGMEDESGSVSMNCLTEDFDDVFAVFADVLRRPVFAEDKVELARVQEKTGIARRNDSIAGITSREFSRLMRGADSPLSAMTEYATIAAVTREDLLAWHARYFHPNNIYLGVVGDFDSKQMKQKILEQFGDWKKGPQTVLPELAYDKQNKAGTYFIEKSDVTQAYVRLGHLGITVGNPDYFAAQVMNEVLGGGFASRLFSNVRSKKGLAYNVFGNLGAGYTRPSFFIVGLSTKSSTMSEAVAALREEIDSIINKPATEAEMQKAKESILNSFVFNYTSKGAILSQQMTYAYYGLPSDYLERYRDNIEKVTREQVAAVAKKYLHPDQLKLLVVGNSAEFDKPMDSFGQVATLDISIPAPPDSTPAVVKSADSMKAGDDAFSKVAALVGGGQRLASLRTDSKIEMSLGGQTMAITESSLLVLPNKLRQSVKLPMGEQTLIISGDRGVASMGGQSQTLPPDAVREALLGLGRELLFLAGNFGNPTLEAVAAGSESVDGRECTIVAVDFNGSKSRLWVDAGGHVLKQTYQGMNPMTRAPTEVEVSFSDYREVQGHTVPHKRVMSFDGQKTIDIQIDSYQFNPDVAETSFELPEAA